jgi:MFS family permease
VPGFARLYGSMLLGRLAGSMLAVALILFVLARYHSPELAGLTVFLQIFPGLVVSPIAGALLDRQGRARLIIADYVIAATTVALIALLAARQQLPPQLMLVIVAISSLTNPLSNAGNRSLFPIIAPRHLWERANALDSSAFLLSMIVGGTLAGLFVSWLGPEWALVIVGIFFAVSALSILGFHDPSPKSGRTDSILEQALHGLAYVLRNPTLRGLALTLSTYNMSWGILQIGIPVLLLDRLHQSAATVGYVWGALGVAGLLSALVAGRIKSQGRERQLMLGSIIVGAVALAILPVASTVELVFVAVIAVGISNGPFDIALFTLRQRRTDPAWFGRAFAVSMSLNFAGVPIGSAIAGPLIGFSLEVAFVVAVVIALASALFPLWLIPREDDSGRLAPKGRIPRTN